MVLPSPSRLLSGDAKQPFKFQLTPNQIKVPIFVLFCATKKGNFLANKFYMTNNCSKYSKLILCCFAITNALQL
jgi:hypothetical protein